MKKVLVIFFSFFSLLFCTVSTVISVPSFFQHLSCFQEGRSFVDKNIFVGRLGLRPYSESESEKYCKELIQKLTGNVKYLSLSNNVNINCTKFKFKGDLLKALLCGYIKAFNSNSRVHRGQFASFKVLYFLRGNNLVQRKIESYPNSTIITEKLFIPNVFGDERNLSDAICALAQSGSKTVTAAGF